MGDEGVDIEKLREWVAHAVGEGDVHVSIPVHVVEAIIEELTELREDTE